MRVFLLLLSFACPLVAAEKALTLQESTAKPPATLTNEQKALLADTPLSVVAGSDQLLRLWLRKSWPSQASAEQVANGLTIREVEEGSWLGVVEFNSSFTDYRKQEIPKGVYTLRLGFQPDLGDHKDTAPHMEFLLLCPLKEDTSTESLEMADAIKLSSQTTGGEHPGVLLLYPAKANQDKPSLKALDTGITGLVLSVKVKTAQATTPLSLALVVDGISPKR